MTPNKQIFHSTPNALNTASSALEYDIIWKELISSGGTAAICTNDVAGSSTFFAPLSKHTCKVFASFSLSTAKNAVKCFMGPEDVFCTCARYNAPHNRPSTATAAKILFFNIVPPCKFYAFSKAISSL